jgi:bifunctional DNase/RNase
MDQKIRLYVTNIINTQAQQPAYAMILREGGGERRMAIIIGYTGAEAITDYLTFVKHPRPLTYDLFEKTLRAFQIKITEVLIQKAEDGVFHSSIYYEKAGEEMVSLDARTSDAVALAIRWDAPIYIHESLLERECIPMSVIEKMETKAEEEPYDLSDKDIQALRKDLDRAIKDENYELASILRDEIARRQ